jgi:myo-inositol-1(or 4)-monophosphatase
MTADFRRELECAVIAATDAAAKIRALYKTGAEVRYKTAIEPVTEADVVADRLIRRHVAEAFPDDAWLSEESKDDLVRLETERVWIVDPLDGTREFIAGRPEFAVSIGLIAGGRPIVGAIVNPVTNECFSAVAGQGAWLDGEPLRVNDSATLAGTTVAVSRNESKRGVYEPFKEEMTLDTVGGMAHKLSLVARGKCAATFTTKRRCEWDIAAGLLIVQEAGGRMTDLHGQPLLFNQRRPSSKGMVASNGQVHDELLAKIAKLSPPKVEKTAS